MYDELGVNAIVLCTKLARLQTRNALNVGKSTRIRTDRISYSYIDLRNAPHHTLFVRGATDGNAGRPAIDTNNSDMC